MSPRSPCHCARVARCRLCFFSSAKLVSSAWRVSTPLARSSSVVVVRLWYSCSPPRADIEMFKVQASLSFSLRVQLPPSPTWPLSSSVPTRTSLTFFE